MMARRISAHTGSAGTCSESVGPRPSAAGANSQPAAAGLEPRVAAVIVNFRQPELTREAIDSIFRSEGVSVSVCLIENAGDGQWAREIYDNEPRVDIIANPENIGFGAACNQGIERVLAEDNDFVFLLNNDATVDPQTLTLLAASSGPHSQSTSAPKILLPDGRLYAAGGVVELGRARARNRGIYETDRGQFDRREPVDFASACALIIPRRALEGGIRFHEPYFLYYEDADLCLQLRKAGFPIIYEPRARVVHHESASTPQNRRTELLYYETRNRIILLFRHGKGGEKAVGCVYVTCVVVVKVFSLTLRGRFGASCALLGGLIDGLRGRAGRRPLE